MTARTDAIARHDLALLSGGIAVSALLAAMGTGPAAVAVLPFAAAVLLAMLGQATAWLWLLVVLSGVGLSWVDGGVTLLGRGINVAGLQWGVMFVLGSLLLVLLSPAVRTWPLPLRLYLGFVTLAALGIARSPDRFEGLKHALQYATPLIIAAVAWRGARDERDILRLRMAFWVALMLAGLLAAVSLGWSRFTGEAPGLSGALGNRTFAIFLIPLYALALAAWRCRGFGYGLAAVGVFVLILLTLSRTVTAVALILFAAAWMWRISWGARAAALAVVLALGVLVARFEPLRGRMFDERATPGAATGPVVTGTGRDAQLAAGNIDLSGRGVLWLQTWRHAQSAPLLGHGTGSATSYLANDLQLTARHPHNDYLRVFHDSGLVGLIALLATAIVGLVSLWRLADRAGSLLTRELALAAWLAWMGYLLIAITDNPMVYVAFFTQNVFLLIALAYAAGRTENGVAAPA